MRKESRQLGDMQNLNKARIEMDEKMFARDLIQMHKHDGPQQVNTSIP